jgi:S-formylglutathione hydrolase FrmB
VAAQSGEGLSQRGASHLVAALDGVVAVHQHLRLPGPLDTPAVSGAARQAEESLYPHNLAFVERLRQLGIPVRSDDYGPGSHDWPYWQRELHRSLPMLLDALQRPPPG